MRLKTGVAGFDKLLEGGLINNQVYIICGPPGSGRTTFAIQFLVEGALRDEKGLYVSFTDNPTNVIKYMSRYNFNLIDHVKSKKIFFMDAGSELFSDEDKKTESSRDMIYDLSASQTTTTTKNVFEKIEPIIKKTDIKRLVLDSTAALAFITKGQGRNRGKEEKEILKIMNSLKQLDVTVLLLSEHEKPESFKLEHYLASGVIFLHNLTGQDSEIEHGIQIIKMRGTRHDNRLHPLAFTANGLAITNNVSS